MRHAPLALIYVATPIVASWPLGPMHGTITEWQQINADHVLEQARKTVEACAAASELPDARTKVLRFSTVPALVEAPEHAQMIVVGSRGTGALDRPRLDIPLGSVSAVLVPRYPSPIARADILYRCPHAEHALAVPLSPLPQSGHLQYQINEQGQGFR